MIYAVYAAGNIESHGYQAVSDQQKLMRKERRNCDDKFTINTNLIQVFSKEQ